MWLSLRLFGSMASLIDYVGIWVVEEIEVVLILAQCHLMTQTSQKCSNYYYWIIFFNAD